MYNLYTESITRRVSPSFSFNNCTQNCSSSFNRRCASSCCCCCCCSCTCCSSIQTNAVSVNSSRLVAPINPNPLCYGFRQSTLIQLPLSRRRLVFGSPIGDMSPIWSRTYGRLDCVRDDRSREEGVKCSGMPSDACNDADELISLLCEGLGEEDIYVSERRKKVGSSKKGMEWCLWDDLESVEERGSRTARTEHRAKGFVKGEGSRLRKGSGLSYYSKVEWDEECAKESTKRVGVLVANKRADEELDRRRIEKYQSFRRDNIGVGTCAGLDLRRKVKKIREGLIEETASGKKSVLNQFDLSDAHVSRYETGSKIKNSHRVGESVSDVNFSFGHSRIDNRVRKMSDLRCKNEAVTGKNDLVDKKSTSHLSKFTRKEEHVISTSEVCGTCGQVTSGSQAGNSNEQKSKSTQIQCDSAGFISSNEKQSKQQMSSSLVKKSAEEVNERHKQEHFLASNRINARIFENYTERADAAERYEDTSISRRHAKLTDIENIDTRLTSTAMKQSDTRIKKQEGTVTVIQASLKKEDERSQQECLVSTSQTEEMRRNQKCTETVDTGNSYLQHTSRFQQQQDTKVRHSEENTVLISSQLAKGDKYQTDIQVTSQNQSRNEWEVLSNSSQVLLDETIVNSSSAFEDSLHSDSQLSQVQGSEANRLFISSKGKKYQADIQVASQNESRRESKVQSGSSQARFDDIKVGSSSASKERLHFESQLAQVKGLEQNTGLISSQLAKGEKYQTDVQFTSQEQSRKESKFLSGSSQVHFDEIIVGSSSVSTERLHSDSQLAQVKDSEQNTGLISSQLAKGEKCQTDIKLTRQEQSKKESKYLSGSSKVHFDDIIVGSSSASKERLQSDLQLSQVKGVEQNTVLISSQRAKGEKYQTDLQLTSQEQSRKESKVLSGSSKFHFDDTIVNSSSTSEERLHSEQTYLTKKVKEAHEHVKETIKHTEVRYEVQMPLREPSILKEGMSRYPFVTPTQTELGYEIQTPLREPSLVKKEMSKYPCVTSTSQVRVEGIDEDDRINLPSDLSPTFAEPNATETVNQTELIHEIHTPAKEPSFVWKETSRHPYLTSTSQVRIEEIGEEEYERNSPSDPSSRLAQPLQSIEVHPVSIESATRLSSQHSRRNSEGESSICIDRLATDALPQFDVLGSAERMESSYHQVVGDFAANIRHQESTSGIEMENKLPNRYLLNEVAVFTCEHTAQSDSESRKLMKQCSRCSSNSGMGKDHLVTDVSPHADLLGSVERMDNLYYQVIGDLAENIRHEPPISLIEVDKKLPKRQLQIEGVDSTHEESVHSDSVSGKLMKEPSRCSSGSGTNKEHTDENLTLQQYPEREASETAATPQNDASRRSGRTLWNVVANVVRLQWGVLRETRKSTLKSGRHSSLSDSTGSVPNFSGHDLNDAQGGNMDLGSLSTPIAPFSAYQPLQVLKMGDDLGLAVDSALSFSSEGIPGETNIDLSVDDISSQATASMDWTQSPASQLRLSNRRSDAIYELQEGGIKATESGTVGEIKGDLDPSLTDVSSSEKNLSELKVDELISPATASMDWTQSSASLLNKLHRRSDAIYEKQEGGIEAMGSGPVGQIIIDLDPSIAVVTSSEENMSKLNSQVTASMDWMHSPASQLRRSHRRSEAVYELQEGGLEATGSGTLGLIKGNLDSNLAVVPSSEKNVSDLKGKNLLRSNQVMKEIFDEYGEAYRLESEQRKIDQTFMRAALEEAKKAAGMWEFPVGAVLVKDGEIIARGHNRVEDLRDSTAHAEILCIREASSIFKEWRLSETVLYVTLEPCAMCAGAILQARIGALVYGAPNKLLGADGSWVRLFPGNSSGDAEGGPESMAKPEGPVHPFHPNMIIRRGILETECSDLMQQSFKLRRKTDKKTEQPDQKRTNRKVLSPSKLLHKMHHMFFFC